jgi:hypothetical protein
MVLKVSRFDDDEASVPPVARTILLVGLLVV